MLPSTRLKIGEQLRDDILCGRLTDGQRLGEVELSRRFAVSRGPIREALALLTQEGLLDFKPNRGVRVAQSAPTEICEFFVPVRRAIEVFCLTLVAGRLGQSDFQAWERILQQMALACGAGDVPGAVQSDLAFHRYLVERSEQSDLISIWQTLVGRLRGHFRQTVVKYEATLGNLYDEHRRLIDVIHSGNLDDAKTALASHIT